MKTTVHAFNFDTMKPADAEAYKALRAQLQGWPHKMRSLGDHYAVGAKLDGREVELETMHLFDNQCNSAPIEGLSDKGYRLFDWAEDAIFGAWGNERKNIRRGYWLEQTPDMREIRRNTMACGYCGKQEPAAKGNVFCPHCLDSEYLKAGDLYLTRMMPVEDGRGKRAPLSEAEKAHLLPLYREAQLHGNSERGRARIAKKRQEVAQRFSKIVRDATIERDGFTWLMDHGVNLDNVIFYSRTGRFGFGWRTPVDAEVLSGLLDIISEFSWPYDIKTADGRTLSGN